MHSLVIHHRRWERLAEKYRNNGPPVNINFWAIFKRSQKATHWSTPESRPLNPTLGVGLCEDHKLYNRFFFAKLDRWIDFIFLKPDEQNLLTQKNSYQAYSRSFEVKNSKTDQKMTNKNKIVFTETIHQHKQYLTPSVRELNKIQKWSK